MSGLSTTAHIPPLFDDLPSPTVTNNITIYPDVRICLLGTRGSGKTCFLGGLAILDRQVGWNLRADSPTTARLDDVLAGLAGPGWPRETRHTAPYTLTVSREGQSVSLLTYDYPGGSVERVLRHLHQDADPELVNHFTHSDVLLVVLDAERDMTDGVARVALLDALKHHFLSGGGRRPSVAVVLTKADRVDGLLRSPEVAERYLREHGDQFLAKIEDLAGPVPVFATSAVGAVDDRGLPVLPPQPAGYEGLFRWLFDRRTAGAAPTARPRAAKSSGRGIRAGWFVAAAVFGLAALAAWRWPDYVGYRTAMDALNDPKLSAVERLERTKNYDGLLSAPVDAGRDRVAKEAFEKLQSTLPTVNDETSARKLAEEAKLTAAWAPGQWRDQLSQLGRKSYEQAGGFAFQRVEQLKRSDDRGWADQARTFLTRYGDAPQVKTLHEWQSDGMPAAQRDARARIRGIEVFDTVGCQNKAAAIRRYLTEFGITHTNEERRKITRAAELADLFGQRQVWAVSFVGSGELKRPYRQWLRLLDNTGPGFVGVEGTPEEGAGGWMQYTDDVFLIEWRPGVPLRVQMGSDETWLPVRRRESVAATTVLDGPVAIVRLLGQWDDDRVEMKADSRWSESFAGTPYARFRVRDLAADDIRIAGEYIHPGDRWR